MQKNLSDDGFDLFDCLKTLEKGLKTFPERFSLIFEMLHKNKQNLLRSDNTVALSFLENQHAGANLKTVQEKYLTQLSQYFSTFSRLAQDNEALLAGVGVTVESLTSFKGALTLFESEFKREFHHKNPLDELLGEISEALPMALPAFVEPLCLLDDIHDFIDEFEALREEILSKVTREIAVAKATENYSKPLPELMRNQELVAQDKWFVKVAHDMGLEVRIPDRGIVSPFEEKNGFLDATIKALKAVYPDKSQDELMVLAVRENDLGGTLVSMENVLGSSNGFSGELADELTAAFVENKHLQFEWVQLKEGELFGQEFEFEKTEQGIEFQDEKNRRLIFPSTQMLVGFLEKISESSSAKFTLCVFYERSTKPIQNKQLILNALTGAYLFLNDLDKMKKSMDLVQDKLEATGDDKLLKVMLILDVIVKCENFMQEKEVLPAFEVSYQEKIEKLFESCQTSNLEQLIFLARTLLPQMLPPSKEDLSFENLEVKVLEMSESIIQMMQGEVFKSFLIKPLPEELDQAGLFESINWLKVMDEFEQLKEELKNTLDNHFDKKPEMLFGFNSKIFAGALEGTVKNEQNDLRQTQERSFRI